MDKRNRLLFTLLCKGIIAILIGANLKINGNPNAHFALYTGLILQFGSLLGLILYNFSKFRTLLK